MIDCSSLPSKITIKSNFGVDAFPDRMWISGQHLFFSFYSEIQCFMFPTMELKWQQRYPDRFFGAACDDSGRYIVLPCRSQYIICSSMDGAIMSQHPVPDLNWLRMSSTFFSRDSSKLIFGRDHWLCVLQLFPKEKQALRSLFVGKPSVSQTISKFLRGKMYVF